jgi:CDP-4-dehydro-6-deoxyglucose reductase, E1
MTDLNWPLMQNNISRENLDDVISYLQKDDPILTASSNVKKFEEEWSKWLGVKHSVFVNSGSSANLLTISVMKHLYGLGEIIVPPLTWSSDISSLIHCGYSPVFADINLHSLGMDTEQILEKITSKTKAVFITHILGYNALTERLLNELKNRNIILIEDVCESHGATFNGERLGNFGLASNFSFYYAHHLSTIEGGMLCTNNEEFYQTARMIRAHGMVRETTSENIKTHYYDNHPDLNQDFIFSYPAYNMRSSEINAIMGLSQLKTFDENNNKRSENLNLFLENLDSDMYFTDFNKEGSCNYAFTLVLRDANTEKRDRIEQMLKEHHVEFRRGLSGGGNQLRQPYLKKLLAENEYEKYPNTEHVHFFAWYIGNYPSLDQKKVTELCSMLNKI